MAGLLNRAKQVTSTVGTGPLLLGPTVTPYQSFGVAGALDGASYSILIEQSSDWELSAGVYSALNQTLTRNFIASSTGSLLSLNGTATVECAASAQDLHPYEAYSGEKVPQLADFTIKNIAGGAGMSDGVNGISIATGASGSFLSCSAFKPVPANGSWSCCMRFKSLMTMHQFATFGLSALNNNTGKAVQLELGARLQDSSSQWNMSIMVDRFNTLTSFNSQPFIQSITSDPLWFRIDLVNNLNLNFYFSPDGYAWFNVLSDPLATFIGSVTHIGHVLQGSNSVNNVAVVSAFSFAPLS